MYLYNYSEIKFSRNIITILKINIITITRNINFYQQNFHKSKNNIRRVVAQQLVSWSHLFDTIAFSNLATTELIFSIISLLSQSNVRKINPVGTQRKINYWNSFKYIKSMDLITEINKKN